MRVKEASKKTCDRESELLECISELDNALEVSGKALHLTKAALDIERKHSARLEENLKNQMTISKSLFELCMILDELCGGYLNDTFGENYREQFFDEFEEYLLLNSGNNSLNQLNNDLESFVKKYRGAVIENS